MKRLKGKKIVCIFAVMALMCAFTACKDNENENEENGEDASVTEASLAVESDDSEQTESSDVTEENSESSETEDSTDSEQAESDDTSLSDEAETTEETDEIVLGYKFDVASNWKLAYADTDYFYYYMMNTDSTYDSSVVLSVTADETLAGASLSDIEDSLKQQYGDDVLIETSTTKENGEPVIYVEFEQTDSETEAYIGQYIVVGEEKAVIFTVYGGAESFETAKTYAGYVVNTISFENG